MVSYSSRPTLLQDQDFQEKHPATDSMRRRELELSAPHNPRLRSDVLLLHSVKCAWLDSARATTCVMLTSRRKVRFKFVTPCMNSLPEKCAVGYGPRQKLSGTLLVAAPHDVNHAVRAAAAASAAAVDSGAAGGRASLASMPLPEGVWVVPGDGRGSGFFETVEAESARDPALLLHLQYVLRKFGAPGS